MYTYLMISEKPPLKTIKIAVCDDEKALCSMLRQKIEKHCKNSDIICQTYECESGEKLLALPAKELPDILFLDIQMPGRNGMQTARELRRKNNDIILIFVTALPEYVYEAFDVNAFHYLVKPFDDNKLQKVLDNAIKQYKKLAEDAAYRQQTPPPAILVKCGGLSTKVSLEDIIYAEVFNRKIMLHTVNGSIEYYGKLTDLSEQTGADFYRTHRAYLVNLKYVEKYNATTVWLEKDTVPISKKQFSGFVQQYMRYLGRTVSKGAGR